MSSGWVPCGGNWRVDPPSVRARILRRWRPYYQLVEGEARPSTRQHLREKLQSCARGDATAAELASTPGAHAEIETAAWVLFKVQPDAGSLSPEQLRAAAGHALRKLRKSEGGRREKQGLDVLFAKVLLRCWKRNESVLRAVYKSGLQGDHPPLDRFAHAMFKRVGRTRSDDQQPLSPVQVSEILDAARRDS